ncbi:MAG TPA: hypothetical protein VK025_09615 [Steroidobacter sp.]|jgi:hypothetical protein|nr:hypothetical protein [Steroidobacteraceae bacterium]HLS81645.1 hypothetical protein [Steroidobacter sp.]
MQASATNMLKDRLRQALLDQIQTASLTTYKELADRLELEPPLTIHRIADALELLMKEDVAAGRPLLAAICVSRSPQRMPARGFFATARALGVFSGDPEGADARAFHARELERALSFYRRA